MARFSRKIYLFLSPKRPTAGNERISEMDIKVTMSIEFPETPAQLV